MRSAALAADPLFNIYRVNKVQPPSLAAPLGYPGQPEADARKTFFNNYEMQKKINALQPNGSMTFWKVCVSLDTKIDL